MNLPVTTLYFPPVLSRPSSARRVSACLPRGALAVPSCAPGWRLRRRSLQRADPQAAASRLLHVSTRAWDSRPKASALIGSFSFTKLAAQLEHAGIASFNIRMPAGATKANVGLPTSGLPKEGVVFADVGFSLIEVADSSIEVGNVPVAVEQPPSSPLRICFPNHAKEHLECLLWIACKRMLDPQALNESHKKNRRD